METTYKLVTMRRLRVEDITIPDNAIGVTIILSAAYEFTVCYLAPVEDKY